MRSFIVEIFGIPKAQKRDRFARRGKFVQTYDPSRDDKDSFISKLYTNRHLVNLEPISGPCYCELCFHMPIPKSTPKKRLGAFLSGAVPHIKKPDLDNLEKLVLDAMVDAGILADDNLIFKVFKEKKYGPVPKTQIKLVEVKQR